MYIFDFLIIYLTLRGGGMIRKWRGRETCGSSLLALRLLFFPLQGREQDFEDGEQWCFLIFHFLWDFYLVELESGWISLSSLSES